ncbi:hypothetical protein GOBAR_AA19597 [Gossypium barbadense]|uniref:Uncharacterized protein n=1 Tax=Gossypium barbadense TaxID=3634 RepID=A0A2P5XCI7_GOSBA|nr:hypothetical protein GOBAR_AA19597 [Gossypium barbadense]
MAIYGNLRVDATLASHHQHPFRTYIRSSKVECVGFMNGGSRFSEITPKWNGMTINSRSFGSKNKRSVGIMGDYKFSPNAVHEEVESFLLHAINMSFFERLHLAWKIVFPSPASRRSSNANIAKQRLKMILFSDRYFVEIESKDKVQLSVSTDSDLGTIYSVTVPVRRVRAEYQEADESGTITNIDYKDTGERSGSVDVRFDFYVPDE